MRAFHWQPSVHVHRWWQVDEHLYVVIDNLVQPRSTSDQKSSFCSSRSPMKRKWNQQDILYNADRLFTYDHAITMQTIRNHHHHHVACPYWSVAVSTTFRHRTRSCPGRRTKQSTVPDSVLGDLSQWYVATLVADDRAVVSNPLEGCWYRQIERECGPPSDPNGQRARTIRYGTNNYPTPVLSSSSSFIWAHRR